MKSEKDEDEKVGGEMQRRRSVNKCQSIVTESAR